MSSHVQVIEQDGKPAFYVVPAALWERMREAAEDAQDIADYLDNDDAVAQYLRVVLAEGDAGELADALGHIAKGDVFARIDRLIDILLTKGGWIRQRFCQ